MTKLNGLTPKAVLFDLDGTLVNTAPDLIHALQAVRTFYKGGALPSLDWSQGVSQGAKAMLTQGLSDMPDLDMDAALGLFLSHYEDNIFQFSHLYVGMDEVLVQCMDQGQRVGVVTNKRHALAVKVLQAAGVMKQCAIVIGGDSTSHAKPHPAPVLAACDALDLDPSETVLVGDDRRDVEAAHASGALALIAGWGYGSGALAERYQSTELWCDSPEALSQRLCTGRG